MRFRTSGVKRLTLEYSPLSRWEFPSGISILSANSSAVLVLSRKLLLRAVTRHVRDLQDFDFERLVAMFAFPPKKHLQSLLSTIATPALSVGMAVILSPNVLSGRASLVGVRDWISHRKKFPDRHFLPSHPKWFLTEVKSWNRSRPATFPTLSVPSQAPPLRALSLSGVLENQLRLRNFLRILTEKFVFFFGDTWRGTTPRKEAESGAQVWLTLYSVLEGMPWPCGCRRSRCNHQWRATFQPGRHFHHSFLSRSCPPGSMCPPCRSPLSDTTRTSLKKKINNLRGFEVGTSVSSLNSQSAHLDPWH